MCYNMMVVGSDDPMNASVVIGLMIECKEELYEGYNFSRWFRYTSVSVD